MDENTEKELDKGSTRLTEREVGMYVELDEGLTRLTESSRQGFGIR
jgi:hypothetical protein